MTVFLPQSRTRPDERALTDNNRSVTWAELEMATAQVANGFAGLGITPGTAVAVMADNSIDWIELMLGSIRAGTQMVPVNWHLTADEANYILADSGARLLLTDSRLEGVARKAAAGTGVDHIIVAGDEWQTWTSAQSADVPLNADAGGPLLYTSGTTGRPKGVQRSDVGGTVDQALARYRAVGDFYRYLDGGTHLVACPLYHASPPAHVLFALTHDQDVVVMDRFDAARTLELIERHRVSSTHLVPTQFIRLLRLDDDVRNGADVSSLSTVAHGAAPCPDWVKRAMIDWFGPVIVEYFGSSEGTGPLIATSDEWLSHPGTVGRPAPTLTVSVVGEDGDDLPTGEVGTLYFRRSDGAPVYRGDPEKTRDSRLPDGRFTVGDAGWVDADGFVFLADRKVDMIISGGVNIYPAEIEGVLSQHPAVGDCAVFGVPDPEWGEAVKAAVTVLPGETPTEAELIEWCRGRMAAFKCPRSIDFHQSLPREESGKLKKRVLRAAYLQDPGRS